MTPAHQPVAEVHHGGLRWHLPTPDANPVGKFLDYGTHLLYDQAAIDAAVTEERERCAKICDGQDPGDASYWAMAAQECARLIRGA